MARENVVLQESLDRYKSPFEHVMRSLDPDDTLSVNDQEIIDGETASQLFRARPETIEEVRLDGFICDPVGVLRSPARWISGTGPTRRRTGNSY